MADIFDWMSARSELTELQLRLELPDDTFLIAAAVGRRAVQIATRVDYYVANRVETIVAAREIVQRGVSPSAARGRQLEHRTVSMRTSRAGCAV